MEILHVFIMNKGKSSFWCFFVKYKVQISASQIAILQSDFENKNLQSNFPENYKAVWKCNAVVWIW